MQKIRRRELQLSFAYKQRGLFALPKQEYDTIRCSYTQGNLWSREKLSLEKTNKMPKMQFR